MANTNKASVTGDQLLAFGTLLARSGKIIESEISGTSMGSTLPVGCRIRISPQSFEQYETGRVIAFVSDNMIFAHRIIFRSAQGALTRGDNHSWCDLPVPSRAILGVVTEYQLDGKWHSLQQVVAFEDRREWRWRTVELVLRMCMRIDIWLAQRVSSILFWLAHWRRRLMASIGF